MYWSRPSVFRRQILAKKVTFPVPIPREPRRNRLCGTNPDDLEEGTPTTITWNSVTLAKDKTFRTYITGVRVQDEGERLPFTAQLAETGVDFSARNADPIPMLWMSPPPDFTLSLQRTKMSHLRLTSTFVRAASLDSVVFTFTAGDTPTQERQGSVHHPVRLVCPAETR